LLDVSNLLQGLNPPQREAVCHVDGPVLVLAGAGSGKTRVITRRIAYLIATGHVRPGNILAVTFTNKAAGEMRERVAELVGAAAAKPIVISTFHSFCLRVLREEIERLGYRKDFTISSEGDARTRVRRILSDLNGHHESFSPEFFLERIGQLKNTDGEPAPEAAKDGEAADEKYRKWLPEVYERYQSALRAANTVDFDDLLLLTLKLWREHPEVLDRYRRQFRHVLVDEFQDTNGVQYALLRALAQEHRNLCAVGDDDQSIYGWRGADIRNILEFERDFREAKVVKLEQNYRSTRRILEAANSVIANNTNRRPKRLWSDLGEGRALDWIVTGDDEHEAKTVVAWLQLIQGKTNARPSDFAVLYRSNTQSRPLEIALRQAGIPYAVYGGQDFFERSEVKDMLAYLRAIQNPYDEAACLRVVNVPRRGVGDVTLHRIHELCRERSMPFLKAMRQALDEGIVTGEARNGLSEFLDLLAEFRKRFHMPGCRLRPTVLELIDRIDYRGELGRTTKTSDQMQARWSNVEAVVNAVGAFEAEHAGATLRDFLDESSLDSGDDRRSKQQRRKDGVSLMTIHSAKGLEFPFVFVVGLEEGVLPHDKSMREGGLEEERRLFYVALTRGQRHVTLFEALSRNRHGREKLCRTSRFMAEIPEALLHRRVLAAREMVEERVAPKRPPRPRRPRRPRG
jgi:superfamily I DNA/RNA helicase